MCKEWASGGVEAWRMTGRHLPHDWWWAMIYTTYTTLKWPTWCMVPLGKYRRSPGSSMTSRMGSPISSWEKLAERDEARENGHYCMSTCCHLSFIWCTYSLRTLVILPNHFCKHNYTNITTTKYPSDQTIPPVCHLHTPYGLLSYRDRICNILNKGHVIPPPSPGFVQPPVLLPLQLQNKCLNIVIVRGKPLGVGRSEVTGGTKQLHSHKTDIASNPGMLTTWNKAPDGGNYEAMYRYSESWRTH